MKSILILVSTLISIAAFADGTPTAGNPGPSCPVIRTAKLKFKLTKYSWVQDGPNWVEQLSTVCTGENDLKVYQYDDSCTPEISLVSPNHCAVQLNGNSEEVYFDGWLLLQKKDETGQPTKLYNVWMGGNNSTSIPLQSASMNTHDLGLKDATFVLQSFLPSTSPGGPRPNDMVSAAVTIEDPSAK